MIVKNTKANQQVRDVTATMAIEDMYLDEEFINELLKVSNGEKTSEQLRKEVLRQYGR